MRRVWFILGLLIALISPASADVFGIPPPFLLPVKSSVAAPLTISCAGTATTSSTVSCSGTYTGTAPSSFSSAVWQSPCSGSVTPPSLSFSGGTWGPANFPTPSGACTGPILVTSNLSTTATSGNVVVSASAIWTLVAHTQLTTGGANGGTTAAIDCTGANLIIRSLEWFAGGSITSNTDSSGNSYGSPIITQGGGAGNNAVSIYAVVNPTVSSSQTFSVAGVGSFPTISIECWNDSSGTPAFDTGAVNNGTALSASTIAAGTFAYLPTVPNALVLTSISSFTSVSVVYTPDSGFTVSDQTSPTASHVGGALAYLIQTTATSVNPIWTLSPPDAGGAGTVLFGFKP